MDSSLAAFLDKGLEFVVGGALFLGSSFFLLVCIGWKPAILVSQFDPALASSIGFGAAMVVAAYAAGVIVESWCRFMFEWDLKRITVRHQAFIKDRNWAEHPEPSSALERVLGRRDSHNYFSAADCAAAEAERERQRARVMTLHAGFYADVESQLKRLRLERVAALSAFLVFAGFVIQPDVGAACTTGLLCVALYRLVHGRFRRYCNAIARTFALVDGGERQVLGDVRAEAAE